PTHGPHGNHSLAAGLGSAGGWRLGVRRRGHPRPRVRGPARHRHRQVVHVRYVPADEVGFTMSEITPGSDLREVADQVSAQARTFLSTVTQVASGGMPGAELSLLVLASSDLLAAGARLAAIVDVVPKERYEPDTGPDTDLDPLREAL